MKEQWYSRSFRRNLVDMHIADWDETFLSEFDPQQYFECLKKAKIQSAMIYLQSHTGLCNWNSRSGHTHRAFASDNKIKTLIDLCHQNGMDVIAYYSLLHNNCAYDDHPEWRTIDYHGHPTRQDPSQGFLTGGRYGILCPNQQGYRDFLKEQFQELCEVYQFEGIFLDMTFWAFPCFCQSCRSRYRKETGREIPETVDWNDPLWIEYQQHRQVWMGEFAQFCTDEIKKLRPEVSVEHQFSTICQPWFRGVDEKLNQANDYIGGDLYGGHQEASYICKLYREATASQPFEYMTSRCDPSLYVHTTTKTKDQMRLQNHLTLAHHGAMLFIDAIDPVGTLNPAVYERIGEVFSETIPLEPFLHGEMMSEAALIMSYDSKYDIFQPPAPVDKAGIEHPQLTAQIGITRVLQEMHMPFTVIPSDRLDKLEGKKAAFLTNANSLRDSEIDALEAYVQKGGNLYISGTTDPRLAERLLGLKFTGYTKESQTYLAPTENGAAVFGEEFSIRYPLAFTGKQMLIENPEGHPVLASITLPYTDPADTRIFASIHSNPPGIRTDHPAILLGQVGKGSVLWNAAAIEMMESAASDAVLRRLITLLAKPEYLHTDAPSCVEMTLFDDPEHKCYLLHLVNAQEKWEILPIYDFTIQLHLPEAGDTAFLLPDQSPVNCTMEKDTLTLSIPKLEIAAHIRIPYKDKI